MTNEQAAAARACAAERLRRGWGRGIEMKRASIWSMEKASSGPTALAPALLTTTSTLDICCTAVCTELSLVTSSSITSTARSRPQSRRLRAAGALLDSILRIVA